MEVQKSAAIEAEAEVEHWRGEVKAANNDGFNNGVKQAGFFNKDLPINLEHCRPWRFIDERGQLNEYRKGTPKSSSGLLLPNDPVFSFFLFLFKFV